MHCNHHNIPVRITSYPLSLGHLQLILQRTIDELDVTISYHVLRALRLVKTYLRNRLPYTLMLIHPDRLASRLL